MSYVPEHVLDDWLRVQQSDYVQKERRTIVKLPCCGAGVEVEVNQEGQDQYITCPNQHCPKRTKAGGARHLLTWGMRPKMQSEGPRLEL